MRIWALLRALIKLLDDDDLVAGLATLEYNGDLAIDKGAEICIAKRAECNFRGRYSRELNVTARSEKGTMR
jgi:hypothetical protein